jgi:hypothetical protein
MLFLQHNQLVTLPDVTGCVALNELHLADNTIKVWVTSMPLHFLLCAVPFMQVDTFICLILAWPSYR